MFLTPNSPGSRLARGAKPGQGRVLQRRRSDRGRGCGVLLLVAGFLTFAPGAGARGPDARSPSSTSVAQTPPIATPPVAATPAPTPAPPLSSEATPLIPAAADAPAGPTSDTATVAPEPTVSASAAIAVSPVTPAELRAVLSDAATDLGMVLQAEPTVVLIGADGAANRWEDDLAYPAEGKFTLGASVEYVGGHWFTRITLLEADGTTHAARAELDGDNYEVQAIRALALLAKRRVVKAPVSITGEQPSTQTKRDVSQGKATLATTGAALGGYFGFALENAGGDVDTRLVYPLVALGAGVGLASALIVAEEWPMDRPSAWFISGGSLWLTLSGVLIASEQALKHPTDRYPYGLIGTATGLGISSLIVSQRQISEAEAVFSQSGALFGTIAGGFVHELVQPGEGAFPKLGVGIGAGGGWLLASLGTAQWLPGLTSSRVLFADLGGFLGTLVGAAAASPTVVTRGPLTAEDSRAFVGASLAGLVVGSVVGYWLGASADDAESELMAVSLRADTLSSDLPRTPFESRLPDATALSLHARW